MRMPFISTEFITAGNRFDGRGQPNKAPEPTPIARRSSAIAVRSLDAAWLSFIR